MKEYVIGHYFSNCMKKIMRYLKNPELLDKDIEKQEEKYKENNNIEILYKNKLNKNVKKVLKKAKKIK